MHMITTESNLFPSCTSFWEDFVNRDMANPFWKTGFNMPATNIVEKNDQFLIHVAIPGVKGSDFNIHINHGVLKIELVKKEEHKEGEEESQYARREFRYSSFKRSFSLPDAVQVDKIHARYEDGILEVILPKQEGAKAGPKRQVPVK
eukprot:gene727-900_t